MKKHGFTLAELIITLSIIGIAAALLVPALSNLVPDKNKIEVIKYKALIENTINEMLNDPQLNNPVPCIGDDGAVRIGDNGRPLMCRQGTNTACADFTCINNGVNILLDRLDDSLYSTNHFLIQDRSESRGGDNNSPEWLIYSVGVDLDLGNGRRRSANNENDYRMVDTFFFGIDGTGTVVAADPLTDAYLRNPFNMSDRKRDFAKAAELSDEISYDYN